MRLILLYQRKAIQLITNKILVDNSPKFSLIFF